MNSTREYLKGLSYPPTLPPEVLELIKKAREVTGDDSIAYKIDSELTVEEFREYLLRLIGGASQ